MINPYIRLGSQAGTPEGAALSGRLTAWHDAMVAHERRLRMPTADACDEECPHAEAGELWSEALATFGPRAGELTFLRSRAVQWHHREASSPTRRDRRSFRDASR